MTLGLKDPISKTVLSNVCLNSILIILIVFTILCTIMIIYNMHYISTSFLVAIGNFCACVTHAMIYPITTAAYPINTRGQMLTTGSVFASFFGGMFPQVEKLVIFDCFLYFSRDILNKTLTFSSLRKHTLFD